MGERGPEVRKRNIRDVKAVIGIDQSYTRTGFSIAINGKLKSVKSLDLQYIPTKTGKRKAISDLLRKHIEKLLTKYKPEEIAVVCERIRQFSGHNPHISMPYVVGAGGLLAVIVDSSLEYGIYTYSVATNSWKARVLGSSKPLLEPLEGVDNPQKIAAVKKVIELGFGENIKKYKNRQKRYLYDDDAADSACIALFPFQPNIEKLLYLETN